MSEPLKGRWTIHTCKDCGGHAHCYDRCPADRRRVWTQVVPVEVVPCDPAAVERGAEAAARFDGSLWNDPADEDAAWYRELAEAVLLAAGSEDT